MKNTQTKIVSASGAMKRRSPWKVSLTWLSTNSTHHLDEGLRLGRHAGGRLARLRTTAGSSPAGRRPARPSTSRDGNRRPAPALSLWVRWWTMYSVRPPLLVFRTHASHPQIHKFALTPKVSSRPDMADRGHRRAASTGIAGKCHTAIARTDPDDHDHPLRRRARAAGAQAPCPLPARRLRRRSRRPRGRRASSHHRPPAHRARLHGRTSGRPGLSPASTSAWMAAARCASRRPAATVFSTRVIRGR